MRPGWKEFGLRGAILGGFAGLFWWLAYTPSAHSWLALLATHAAAGCAFAVVTFSLFPRWGALASLVLGLAAGLVLGPMLVLMPYTWGHLTGLTGFLGIAAAMGIAAVVGLELGRRPVAVGASVLGAAFLGVVGLNAYGLSEREAEAHFGAAHRLDGFPDQPVAIIGIDGGDFSVIDPMMERGELPELAGLIARGRRGVFRSTEPSLSPVVWTTIFSGHPPEVHGLKSWSTSDNRNRRVPMLWDIYGAHDLTSLVVNVPGSWPPAPVVGGRVVSGFPIPGIVSGGRGQLMGVLVTNVPGDEGTLPTHAATQDEPGIFSFDFPIAAPQMEPRVSGIAHPLLDAATQDRLVPVRDDLLRGRIVVEADGVRIESDDFDAPLQVRIGEWSEWARVQLSSGTAYLRLHVIEASADRVRIALTPVFQDPKAPQYPFTSGVDPGFLDALSAPYIVEGPGWRAHEDPRFARLLPEVLADVEGIHTEAALHLMAESPADLLAYTITVTDRIQHPFWRDHEPAPYTPRFETHQDMDPEDPVEQAYRVADRLLGRVLAALSPDTLVFVVSDHGATSGPLSGEGEHRVEGIWIAAGPGVSPTTEMEELSILDLVPTLLHCVGAPAAEDMPGRVATNVCPDWSEEARVASYRPDGQADQKTQGASGERVIDATREEQLRSLGYIE